MSIYSRSLCLLVNYPGSEKKYHLRDLAFQSLDDEILTLPNLSKGQHRLCLLLRADVVWDLLSGRSFQCYITMLICSCVPDRMLQRLYTYNVIWWYIAYDFTGSVDIEKLNVIGDGEHYGL